MKPIKFFLSDGISREITIEKWPSLFQVTWQKDLLFSSDAVDLHIQKRCQKAIDKERLDRKQVWLGVHYSREIKEGHVPAICISWINDIIGYGVFAEKSFSTGDFIGEYTGIVKPRQKKLDAANNYCFTYSIGEWDSPYVIDAKPYGNHTRFINHSDQPNLEPLFVYSDGHMHLILYVKRSIAKGEQLSYDYGSQFWRRREPPHQLFPIINS